MTHLQGDYEYTTGALQRPCLIGIVAGEASGDILGANLMQGLLQIFPHAEFIGVGGDRMEALGLKSLFPMETLSVMGFMDVLKQLPKLLRARKTVLQTMQARQPDVFIGVDAPDFNLPIEKKLKQAGIPTVHYVSPSVWAWRPKRIFSIAKATNLVLGILPFEVDFYARYRVPYVFVGHPLADAIPERNDCKAARETLNLSQDGRYVGILPGSRGSEVGLLSKPFIDAATLLYAEFPDIQFLVAFANKKRETQFMEALHRSGCSLPFITFQQRSQDVLAASDAVLVASGTVSLEAMLIKRPMVVCYRFSWFNYQVLRWFVRVPHFSLPNLLENGGLVPELLQHEVTPERIALELKLLLTEKQTERLQRFSEHHQILRRNAGVCAAEAVREVILKSNDGC